MDIILDKLLIYSTKNKRLLEALNLVKDFELVQKPTFFANMFNKTKQIVDIYFYDGKLEKYNIELLQNAKLIIVNSNSQKEFLENKINTIDKQKIHVIYPYVNFDLYYDKKIKKDFKTLYNIPKKSKIIFFRSNNLSKNGIKQFLSIVSNLHEKNFSVVIESTKKEIEQLKLQLGLMRLNFQIILVEDYKQKEELFMISDIFLFPSSTRFFNLDIFRAAYYKNAIFISENNYASELIDTFATIELKDNISTIFKIDALLKNKQELKNIKTTNFNELMPYTFSKHFSTLQNYLNEI